VSGVPCRAVRVTDHWAASEWLWAHGQAVLTWHFTFEGNRELGQIVREVAPILDRPYLDVVPAGWLHLTVQGVGVEGSVSEGDRTRIADQARDLLRDQPPVRLTLGPAQLLATLDPGVIMPVATNDELQVVRDLLQRADADVRGEAAVPDWEQKLNGHVTLAYANRYAEADDLRDDLVAISDLKLSVTLGTVSLLRLTQRRGLYSWQALAHVQLTG